MPDLLRQGFNRRSWILPEAYKCQQTLLGERMPQPMSTMAKTQNARA